MTTLCPKCHAQVRVEVLDLHMTLKHRARASRQGGQALPSTGAASRARLSLNDDKQTVCA